VVAEYIGFAAKFDGKTGNMLWAQALGTTLLRVQLLHVDRGESDARHSGRQLLYIGQLFVSATTTTRTRSRTRRTATTRQS
jgi:hypothetical protein